MAASLWRGCCTKAPADRAWPHELSFALGGYLFLVSLTYAFTHVLSGRGAFNQIGALIGTIMVANVFAVIIPNQKKIVAALLPGHSPDPELGKQSKQRSVHNNYLTLPVIVLMISNHYPLLFATGYNWLTVAIVLALGPIIRHFFNERHAGRKSPWWVWGVAGGGHGRHRNAVRSRPAGYQEPDRCLFRQPSPISRRLFCPDAACVTAQSRSGHRLLPRQKPSCSTTPTISAATPG